MDRNIKRLVKTALLIAVEFLLSRFLCISTTFMKISFSFSAIAVCAMLYGPVWAGLAAAVTDVLGAVLVPQGGAIFLGFTLSAFLTGFVFGMFFYMKKITWTRALLAAIIVCLAVNFCMGSFWLYVLYGDAVVGMLLTRLIKSCVMIPVEAVTVMMLSRVLSGLVESEHEDYRAFLRKSSRRLLSDGKKRGEISDRICERVVSSEEFLSARTVFCYVSVEGEVATEAIINRAFECGKRVCVPLCEGRGVMSARFISDISELKPGKYGIPEPSGDSRRADPEEIDLAVIPCSACDRLRNRVGKGAGFYDRFLAGTRMFKMGLCPRSQTVDRLPVREHDVPLDAVICETKRL